MERLWSPWRRAYVTGARSETTDCIFCTGAEPDSPGGPGGPGGNDLLLVRGEFCYVILNLYPYNSGHLMVVPNRHVATLHATTAAEREDIMRFTRYAEMALTEAYTPQGVNVGINLGRPAGAGVLDHLHVHVVPRWNGDTNFMTVIGETRVLPEDLAETKRRLQPVLERLLTARA